MYGRSITFNMDKGISNSQVQLRMVAGIGLLCVPGSRFQEEQLKYVDKGCRSD
eukprot:COSAG05_NODE_2705_length_2744_cov_5.486578_1_plen_53_part_00